MLTLIGKECPSRRNLLLRLKIYVMVSNTSYWLLCVGFNFKRKEMYGQVQCGLVNASHLGTCLMIRPGKQAMHKKGNAEQVNI